MAKKLPKLWGLEVRTFNKAAQQYMDVDYVNKLNDEEKQWLSQFNNEYFGNTLNKDWRKNLHMKDSKKAIYDQTNARNRDMYNKRYRMNDEDHMIMDNFDNEYTSPEDALIDFMDKEEKIKKFVDAALKARTEKGFTKELTKAVFDIE